jgi:hypothetical protein
MGKFKEIANGQFSLTELAQRRGRSNRQWTADWIGSILWVFFFALPEVLILVAVLLFFVFVA